MRFIHDQVYKLYYCHYDVKRDFFFLTCPEALKRSMEMGARAYLPKEKLGEIVPFLEDVLTYEYLPGWKRLLMKLEKTFIIQWGEYWKKSDETFWKEFEEKAKHKIVW